MSNGEPIRLKVAESNQGDVGKGIIRVSEHFLETLNARTLDVVEVTGTRTTAALAVNAYSADQGSDIARMDGLIRSNAGASIGQYVDIKKAVWSEAKHVTLAPVTPGMQILLRAMFLLRSSTEGPLQRETSSLLQASESRLLIR